MKATAVKFADGSTDVLRICAVPFGGPFNGRDTDGEFFSAKTELCLDWFPEQRPLLYHHGLDGRVQTSVVGRVDVTTASKAADGLWVQAQLDASSSYFDSIKELVEAGKLYASSGAMPHLVQRAKTGELTRWPWVELSLTPTPANLYAVVEPAEVAKHYKSAGLAFGKAELDAAARDKLSDGDYAYIDSDGGRHLPINDAAHVRAAMSRFNQTQFDSDEDKRAAAKRIIARAKELGIDVADDSAVAEAAKAAKETAHTATRNHYHSHADGTSHSHAHEHPSGTGDHDGDDGQHKYGSGKSRKADGAILADGDDGDAPEGSLEDWLEDLSRALNRGLGGPFGDCYADPVATYGVNGDGYAVVCVREYGDGMLDYDAGGVDVETAYYRVEFSMGDDGQPVLGAVSPLQRAYIPVAKSAGLNSTEPLILAARAASKHAAAVAARTRDVQERRIKEGRVLSGANVQRLQALQKSLKDAASEIGDLLDSASPPAKAADLTLLQQADARIRHLRLITTMEG